MKSSITTMRSLMAALVFLVTACSKNDVQQPGGGNGGNGGNPQPTQGTISFTLENLPANPGADSLFAIVSLTDEQQGAVWTRKKLPLSTNGQFSTEAFPLNKGNYRVSSLTVMDKAGKTRFIIPMGGSRKAATVTKPLAQDFAVQAQSAVTLKLQVAQIFAGDVPADYGYPEGSFESGGEAPVNQFVKILVQPLVRIGNIVYDSIPVSYELTTWEANGQASTQTGGFGPGKNELSLRKAASRYLLKVTKWGTTDELSLLPADIQEGTVYSIGGSRDAKKLSAELTYRLDNGVAVPLTRTLFEYDGAGRLVKILYYKRKADNTPYLDMTEVLEYNGQNKARIISQYNSENALVASTELVYDNEGRPTAMNKLEGANRSSVAIQYTPRPGGTGISGNYEVLARYSSTSSDITMSYTMIFGGGNNLSDAATSSNHNSTLGAYQYDFNINPFIHLNRPDIMTPVHSRHNIKAEQKSYHGSYPTVVPYDFIYSYDADGYPKEVVKSYKSYLTGVFQYKIKTVYTY